MFIVCWRAGTEAIGSAQARIQWMASLGEELGGPAKAQAMIKGQGISLILKSIEVQFRRPVIYPDTVRDSAFDGLVFAHPDL